MLVYIVYSLALLIKHLSGFRQLMFILRSEVEKRKKGVRQHRTQIYLKKKKKSPPLEKVEFGLDSLLQCLKFNAPRNLPAAQLC